MKSIELFFSFVLVFQNKESEFQESGRDVNLTVMDNALIAVQGTMLFFNAFFYVRFYHWLYCCCCVPLRLLEI